MHAEAVIVHEGERERELRQQFPMSKILLTETFFMFFKTCRLFVLHVQYSRDLYINYCTTVRFATCISLTMHIYKILIMLYYHSDLKLVLPNHGHWRNV